MADQTTIARLEAAVHAQAKAITRLERRLDEAAEEIAELKRVAKGPNGRQRRNGGHPHIGGLLDEPAG